MRYLWYLRYFTIYIKKYKTHDYRKILNAKKKKKKFKKKKKKKKKLKKKKKKKNKRILRIININTHAIFLQFAIINNILLHIDIAQHKKIQKIWYQQYILKRLKFHEYKRFIENGANFINNT